LLAPAPTKYIQITIAIHLQSFPCFHRQIIQLRD